MSRCNHDHTSSQCDECQDEYCDQDCEDIEETTVERDGANSADQPEPEVEDEDENQQDPPEGWEDTDVHPIKLVWVWSCFFYHVSIYCSTQFTCMM